jgi:hypothetical protein
LAQPRVCPPKLYEAILKSWKLSSHERLAAAALEDELQADVQVSASAGNTLKLKSCPLLGQSQESSTDPSITLGSISTRKESSTDANEHDYEYNDEVKLAYGASDPDEGHDYEYQHEVSALYDQPKAQAPASTLAG